MSQKGVWHPPKKRCTGKNRRGGQCGRPPMKGAPVCRKHGGQLPVVIAAAKRNLEAMKERALVEAERLAFSNIRELFDDKGAMKPMSEWPAELAAAVGSVDVVRRNVVTGDNQLDEVLKVKVWDKPKALQLLFQHLGMLKEQVEHSGSVSFTWEK